MKILLLAITLFLCGCSTLPKSKSVVDASYVSQVLDTILPAEFTGPGHVKIKNPWFTVTIDAGGLKRTTKGWTWTWLRYSRDDLWQTSGDITFGIPPS